MRKYLQLITAAVLLLTGCKTAYITIPITYDPMIKLPDNYKISVLNASWSDSTKQQSNLIESIVTGEALGGDRQGSEDCIQSFSQSLNTIYGMQVTIPINHLLKRNKPFEKQNSLDWNTVISICRKNNTDALAALEQFDTNSDALIGSIMTGINLIGNGGVPQPHSIHYHIHYYWRIYDTLSKTIVDQFGEVLEQETGAASPLGGLPQDAIKYSAQFIGNNYASRFIGPTYWDERNYFKKANNDFKVAARRARMNDWTGAMDIWSKYTDNSKRKIAGRACYNMALGNEVNGDLNAADTWAKKAFTDYNLKKAKYYDDILKGRLYHSH